KMASAANFLRDIRLNLLAELRRDLGNNPPVRFVQQTLFDLLGPAWLGVLKDTDGNGVVDINDVTAYWADVAGTPLLPWREGEPVPEEADSIEFDMDLGGTINLGNLTLPLGFDAADFNLDLSAGLDLSLDWELDFGFGISETDFFYLKTNSDGTDEFSVDLSAHLNGGAYGSTF